MHFPHAYIRKTLYSFQSMPRVNKYEIIPNNMCLNVNKLCNVIFFNFVMVYASYLYKYFNINWWYILATSTVVRGRHF